MPKIKLLRRNAVKEGFDRLPLAVCFFNTKGIPVLCNLQMYRLSRYLLGSDLQYLGEMEMALNSPPTGVTPTKRTESTYIFPDKTVWQFEKSVVSDGKGSSYIRLMAADVTELHNALLMQEQENKQLRKDATELAELSENAQAVAREKERLSAKSALHDSLAACLTVTKQYVGGNLKSVSREQIISEWEHSIAFRNMGKMTAKERLLSQAEKSGIKLRADGAKLPDEYSDILYSAIVVTLNNAVQYAKATELHITVTQGENYYIISIRNDGISPEKEIVEGGGLTNLRRKVEKTGGYMRVQSLPDFVLRIGVPKR